MGIKNIKKVKQGKHFYFQTQDGKIFSSREEAKINQEKIKKIKECAEIMNTVFDNSEEVLNSLIEGLERMLQTDRENFINHLSYIITK